MSARATVLVVDDEPGMREMLSWELAQEGFEVETAESGMAAVEVVKRRKFDLAVTDLKMPGMDGIATIDALREVDPDIEVIVATGYATVDTAIACLKRGAYDYVLKPYDLGELKLSLDRAIQKNQLQGAVALYEASRDLLGTLLPAELIRRVLIIAPKVLKTDEAALVLWGDAPDQCSICGSNGTTTGMEPLLSDLARRCLSTGTPLCMPSSSAGELPLALAERHFASVLVYPLAVGDRQLGSLTVFRRSGSSVFVRSDMFKGTVFANQLSLSIENARLYEQLQTKVAEVQSAYETLARRTAQLEETTRLQKQAEEALTHLATHDPLTGLPNRVLLHDRFMQTMARARRYEYCSAFMLLDLDRFKEVNDTLGHDAGDLLLREVGARLSRCVREYDTVARMGGDEFVVVLGDLKSGNEPEIVAHRIREAIAKPFKLGDQETHVSTSVGISLYPSDAEDIESLLKNADIAMYAAKANGGDEFCFFSAHMSQSVQNRMHYCNGLRTAIAEKQFRLEYQPLIELSTGRISSAEALLRWHHPDKGVIAPLTFIPIAESSGLIVPIGEWVLAAACEQNKKWQDAGLPPIPIAVNVSARQLLSRGIEDVVLRIVQESGLSPEKLIVEITESTAMKDVQESIRILNHLHSCGIQIVIDDFGSGYSSLNWLKRLPVQALKIDRFFLQHIVDDPSNVAIVKAVIAMARSLHIGVIAEGVESLEQLELLRTLKWSFEDDLRCDQVQGYLFSKPVSAEDFSGLLAKQEAQGVFWRLPEEDTVREG